MFVPEADSDQYDNRYNVREHLINLFDSKVCSGREVQIENV